MVMCGWWPVQTYNNSVGQSWIPDKNNERTLVIEILKRKQGDRKGPLLYRYFSGWAGRDPAS